MEDPGNIRYTQNVSQHYQKHVRRISDFREGRTGPHRLFFCNSWNEARDVLSPLLFIILLDFVLRKTDTIKCGIERAGGKRLRDLDYADYICLLAKDVEEMQMIVDTIVTEADKIGIKINTVKTDIMKIRTHVTRSLSIGSSNLQEVNNFVYQ